MKSFTSLSDSRHQYRITRESCADILPGLDAKALVAQCIRRCGDTVQLREKGSRHPLNTNVQRWDSAGQISTSSRARAGSAIFGRKAAHGSRRRSVLLRLLSPRSLPSLKTTVGERALHFISLSRISLQGKYILEAHLLKVEAHPRRSSPRKP